LQLLGMAEVSGFSPETFWKAPDLEHVNYCFRVKLDIIRL